MCHVGPAAQTSDPALRMTSAGVLVDWCRATCATYPSVDIRDMSSSFRDGLAFCAIIHRHRPDLIDFSSLSKDNVYQNNKLAFEVAESQLGIPALLDPKDMVSTKVPDCLSVISYLCQFYFFFNRKSHAAPRPSHGSMLNHLTKTKRSDGLKHLKSSLTDLDLSGDDFGLSKTRPHTVCSLCLKPVQLIQRRVVDGKVFHRGCFRCKLCHSSLLPGSYTKGSDSCSLICSYHTTDSTSSVNQQSGCADKETGFYSLDGSAITRVPHYIKKTESQDRLVFKAENRDRGDASAPRPLSAAESETQTSEPSASCPPGGKAQPVPAPRRLLNSTAPVPAPRTKTCPMTTHNNTPAAGSSSPPDSSHVTSPKAKTNHPWMSIVHPGPWTQLPPAPAPIPTPRSKPVSNLRESWNKARIPAPNPFEEEEEEEEDAAKLESTDQTKPESEENEGKPATRAAECIQGSVPDSGSKVTDDTPQSHRLPRSLSVPAITSDPAQTVTPCQSKAACRENPFNPKPSLTKSQTFQDVSSSRGPAPGHGFPLIKRKVQSEQDVNTENLHVQMREVEKHLQELEHRGVELERSLRDNRTDKEEERMLTEWFGLIHERHTLLRRDTELVYLMKQQKLENKQADVEFELRCLLNKPESDWSQEDRRREGQLMKELVSIIEQRNQIISILDQDRQREREEDVQWEDVIKNKHLQKEELKELKKSKGKFRPTKVFKMLNHKESSKEAAHKKN